MTDISSIAENLTAAVREVHWREAEEFASKRLDRRRKYAIGPDWDGGRIVLLELCTWTTSCSGCFEGGECMGLAHHYPYDTKRQCHVGAGCAECGYSGKVRQAMWLPTLRAYLEARG